MRMYILSWNVHQLWWPIGMCRRGWRARKARKVIQDLMPKPNVVCLQEVWRKGAAKVFMKTRGYEKFFWFPRAGLLIMSDRADTRLLQEKKFVASVDWPFTNKGYQIIRYGPHGSLVVNTHMQAGFSGILRRVIGVEDYTAVKEYQLREIQEDPHLNIDKEAKKYVCGDFNLDIKDEEQADLVEQYANMMGLYDPIGEGQEKRVDWILLDVDVEDYAGADILQGLEKFSDHPALMAFIALRRSRAPETPPQASDQ